MNTHEVLPTLKQIIKSAPDVPFSQYYQQYICDVQDQAIEYEIDSLNNADILSLDALISKLFSEIKK